MIWSSRVSSGVLSRCYVLLADLEGEAVLAPQVTYANNRPLGMHCLFPGDRTPKAKGSPQRYP